MLTTIKNLREDYKLDKLNLNDLLADPIELFKNWFDKALQQDGLAEPNAMTLSTVSNEGKPSARIVLLKEVQAQGFVFYTNYNSKKGIEMKQNQYVALTFWWPPLQQQVRIEGKAVKISTEASTEYFNSRPKGSQLGAITSPQSQIIKDRTVLEERLESLKLQYKGIDQLPRPDHWGGYLVVPELIEFWQGRQNRLHDRFVYTLTNKNWKIERLAP